MPVQNVAMSTQSAGRYFPEWTLGDRLRRIRRDTGLTQEAFAERLQVGAQRYSAWEAGRNQPTAADFIGLAKRIELACGVAAEWTLGIGSQEPDPDGGLPLLRARRDSNPKPSGWWSVPRFAMAA